MCLNRDMSLGPWPWSSSPWCPSSEPASGAASTSVTVTFGAAAAVFPAWNTLSRQFLHGCTCSGYENNTKTTIASCPTAMKSDVDGYIAMMFGPTYEMTQRSLVGQTWQGDPEEEAQKSEGLCLTLFPNVR